MRLMIASDIHGSEYFCRELVNRIEHEMPDKILLLGDILYHGPRNDLPREYAPKSVISMLNQLRSQMLCVRGNCDTEVDQMVLDFPILADYAVICIDGITVYATHGHHFSEDNPPPLSDGDILICGHTHIPKCVQKTGYIYLNPGSVSIPKENSEHSYMIYEDRRFIWKTLQGKEYMEFKI